MSNIYDKVERALTDGEGFFRHLAENIPLVFWVRELPSNRIGYVSPAYEQVWGRKLGSFDEAYQSFLQSIHPDDREALFRQMQNETGNPAETDSEYRIVRPDGTIRWIHSRAIPFRDESGQVSHIIGFAEDITPRKLAEQALREALQRQRTLLDSIPDAAWLVDADGRYVAVNRTYARRWGPGLQDAIGKSVCEFLPMPIAEENAAEDREILRTGKPLHIEKHRVIRGQEYWFNTTKVPSIDEAGNVTGIACISRDITERKLAEAQRMARDAGLRAALIKEVHHRIKNNLQGVITFIQQLTSHRPENASLVAAVIARVNAIASVHGLFGALGESDHRLEDILLTLVSSLKVINADLPVRLSIRSSPESVRVTAGEIVPLALVVNELIMNAIKHSRSTVDSDPVEIVLESTGDCARITISTHSGQFPGQFDFAIGVGLGTGLALVKSLLPPAGAELRFDNLAAPDGTTVELTLRPPVINSLPWQAS